MSRRARCAVFGITVALLMALLPARTDATPTVPLLITPNALEFGPVQIDASAPDQIVNITNVSAAAMVISAGGGGVASPFGGFQNCQSKTLNPGDSCQFTYQFAPTALGGASTNSVGAINGVPFNIALHGTGIAPALRISPTSLEFGEITVGSSAPNQVVTITNVGTAPVLMSGAGGGVGAPFSGFQSCQLNTLNPGASCQMTYSFAPTGTGAASTTSSGTWNGIPFNIALSGTGIAADTTPPLITPSVVPASPSLSGWYRVSPMVSFAIDDPESPVTLTTDCDSRTIDFDTNPAGLTLTCTASSAGGTSSVSVTILRDATPPFITGSVTPPVPSTTGWYNIATGAPTVSFACQDPVPGSGLASCSSASTLGTSAGAQSVTGTAQDTAGNSASTTVSGLRVDLVAPAVSCGSAPSFVLGASGTVVGSIADAHSGPATPSASAAADTSSPGTKTAMLTGADVAGNVTTVACPYVVGFTFVGFLPPLPANSVNSGATVSVKFALADARGARISDALAASLVANCGVTVTFTGGTPTPNCAAYDADEDQFKFNLKLARSLAPGAYTITAHVFVGGADVTAGSTVIGIR